MTAARALRAAPLLLALLAACAPTHEWVHPAVGPEGRALDARDCSAEAWDYAQHRRFLYGGGYGGFSGGRRGLGPGPWGGVGWSQANTLEALDRNRYFEGCMRVRGYTQQPVRPE